MKTQLTPLEELELEAQQLLKILVVKREAVYQGEALQRLQLMLQDIYFLTNSFSEFMQDESTWQDVQARRRKIEQCLKNLVITDHSSALSLASAYLSLKQVLPTDLTLADFITPPQFQSPDSAIEQDNASGESTAFVERLPIYLTAAVLTTIFLTIVIGGVRLGQSHRLSPGSPFITEPSILPK